MLSFLFWNLNGNGTNAMRERICRFARTFDIDVFVFVESSFEPGEISADLNAAEVGVYCYSEGASRKVHVFTRLPEVNVKPLYDSTDGRLTIREVHVSPHKILLAAVHLKSQLHQTPDAAGFQMMEIQNDIADIERNVDNYHTLVVGDFNVNPFDHGMVAAQAWHSVMERNTAKRKERIVEGRSHRFFYNPMWAFFGDRSAGPPGTYYYSASSSIEYFWHVFDQVLLRPELMATLAELEILQTDGERTLLNELGRPDVGSASDHLPILFRLNLDMMEVAK